MLLQLLLSAAVLQITDLAGENQVKAVNQVDIQIEQGEFVAIVGKSGSGKSTFLPLTHIPYYREAFFLQSHPCRQTHLFHCLLR